MRLHFRSHSTMEYHGEEVNSIRELLLAENPSLQFNPEITGMKVRRKEKGSILKTEGLAMWLAHPMWHHGSVG